MLILEDSEGDLDAKFNMAIWHGKLPLVIPVISPALSGVGSLRIPTYNSVLWSSVELHYGVEQGN